VLLVDHNQTGYGGVGPAMNFAEIPAAGTWVLTLFMMPGRLDAWTPGRLDAWNCLPS
jgi:hypothetical protein